jgi:hypothetical protein
MAEENLLLLGLQVHASSCKHETLAHPTKVQHTLSHMFSQRFGPDFPAISDTLMPNKSADLLRYRYKVPTTHLSPRNKLNFKPVPIATN